MPRSAADHARPEPSCGFAGRRAAAGGSRPAATSCPAEQIRFPTLERVTDEEFTLLSRASNNSPRRIWSDGAVMYVADESDDTVCSSNMPDAIAARLAALSLSGVDFGEFGGARTEYAGVPADGVTETTVEAEAAQGRASVSIEPPDTDQSAAGHLVALGDVPEITVTVTSPDGSRARGCRARGCRARGCRVLIGQEEAPDAGRGALRGRAGGFPLQVIAHNLASRARATTGATAPSLTPAHSARPSGALGTSRRRGSCSRRGRARRG